MIDYQGSEVAEFMEDITADAAEKQLVGQPDAGRTGHACGQMVYDACKAGSWTQGRKLQRNEYRISIGLPPLP